MHVASGAVDRCVRAYRPRLVVLRLPGCRFGLGVCLAGRCGGCVGRGRQDRRVQALGNFALLQVGVCSALVWVTSLVVEDRAADQDARQTPRLRAGMATSRRLTARRPFLEARQSGRCRVLAERRQRLSGVARCRTTFHRFAMSASEAMRVEDASRGLCRMRAASVSRRDSRGRDRALVATQLCQVGPPGRSGLTNSALVAQLRRGRCTHSSPSLRPAPVAIDRVPDDGP
jgi:hypothetical protein